MRHFKTMQAKRHTINDLKDRYIKDVLPIKGKVRPFALKGLTPFLTD